MKKPPHADTPLRPTLDDLIARENVLYAIAREHGLGMHDLKTLSILRDATGFFALMSEGLAKGIPADSLEMFQGFQWAVMKVVEFNERLPEHLRGDLTYDCFRRQGGAAGAH